MTRPTTEFHRGNVRLVISALVALLIAITIVWALFAYVAPTPSYSCRTGGPCEGSSFALTPQD